MKPVICLFILLTGMVTVGQDLATKNKVPIINRICGNDDREPATNPAVGRIIGYDADGLGVQLGTGFLTNNGKIVSAAHVYRDGAALANPAITWVIEFNVPESEMTGELRHPPAKDIYKIIYNEQTIGTAAEGDDWWIFEVELNHVTGLHPISAQSSSLTIDTDPILPVGTSLKIQGYGYASGVKKHTLQEAFGTADWVGLSQHKIGYEIDTHGGNSGSPVIDLVSNKVVAIHTDGEQINPCRNFGNSMNISEFVLFWSQPSIYKNVIIKQKELDNPTGKFVGKVGIWGDNSFSWITPTNSPSEIRLLREGGTTLTYRGDIDFIELPQYQKTMKFHSHTGQFISNQNVYVNFLSGSVTGNTAITTYVTETADNTTLQNLLSDGNLAIGGAIKFLDPWLEDVQYSPYGKINQGVTAPFKQRTSPFYPDYTTNYNGDVYKGVFLDQEISSNSPYYSVQAISPQTCTLAQTNREHTFYFQNWSANTVQGVPGAVFQNANSPTTGVVFKKEGAVVSANMKGTQLSSQSEAFKHNGQNKIVRIPGNQGIMYQVYESMGNIWLEVKLTDQSEWMVLKKLSAANSKNPSLTYLPPTSSSPDGILAIVYVEDNSEGKVRIHCMNVSDGREISEDAIYLLSAFSEEITPVIAGYGSNKFMIVVNEPDENSEGMWFNRGEVSFSGMQGTITWEEYMYPCPTILNTTKSSINPAISSDGTSLHLAWEENGAIKYIKITETNGTVNYSLYSTPSSLSGFTENKRPSITGINGGARIVWVGKREREEEMESQGSVSGNTINKEQADSEYEYGVVFRDPGYPYYWHFAYDNSREIQSPVIRNYNSGYTFAWSEKSGASGLNYFADNALSTIRPIKKSGTPLNGKYVQLSNGATQGEQYASVYRQESQPYFFTLSDNINTLKGLSKEANLSITAGREGILKKEGIQFYYGLGDITKDGAAVEFVEIPDTAGMTTLNELNGYMSSKPFEISGNSVIKYSIGYGTADSAGAVNGFGQGEYVRFKLLLRDAVSNEALGVLDEVEYSAANVNNYSRSQWQLDVSGYGGRQVKLQLITEENIGAEFTIAEKMCVENTLAKSRVKKAEVKNGSLITAYELYQNHPNPFGRAIHTDNPETSIKYQIPEAGVVSLKVYDILGREITALVNETKPAGSYSVNFNASPLPSGVYIYELKAGSGTVKMVKKMMILK